MARAGRGVGRSRSCGGGGVTTEPEFLFNPFLRGNIHHLDQMFPGVLGYLNLGHVVINVNFIKNIFLFYHGMIW